MSLLYGHMPVLFRLHEHFPLPRTEKGENRIREVVSKRQKKKSRQLLNEMDLFGVQSVQGSWGGNVF